MIRRLAALLAGLLLILQPVRAQAPGDAFDTRAKELVSILAMKGDEQAFFAPAFLAQIHAEQIRSISQSLVAQNGAVTGLEGIERANAQGGTVIIGYERARVRVNLSIAAAPPNQVIGLLISAVQARDDSATKIGGELAALPGNAGMLLRRIDDPSAPPLLSVNPEREYAIGSGFKLWVLAEAARAVAAGERKWSDIIPLGDPALPSGITQSWPPRAPMTLHSLATLMISISDNTASDTLLHALGRERVGMMVGVTGHAKPEGTLPVLSTTEAFALKMDANADLRARWTTLAPKDRLALLGRDAARLGRSAIDPTQLAGTPRAIEAIEWFASPADMARTFGWLRTKGGTDALAILAVNPGIAPGEAARFSYVGFKGGSEGGVVSLNFLVKAKSGHWYTLTGSWNDPKGLIDEKRFVALASRALALIEP